MHTFVLTPTVDHAQEFIEIANDFANPLDLVREAISNSFDAGASNIRLEFKTERISGEQIFVIVISDDGLGMNEGELQSFFDLGNSTRRLDDSTIGEKGHGTKVYFNAKKVIVNTCKGGVCLNAVLDSPFIKLHDRTVPEVLVTRALNETSHSGTRITIFGYNNNRRERFTHGRIKDHIYWFTKFGSIEQQFGLDSLEHVRVHLKGLDAHSFETLKFGHPFPAESESVDRLFERHFTEAPHHYSRMMKRHGNLPNHPEYRYNAIFSIEGRRVKYLSNPMIRRQRYEAPEGAYTIQERYGLWLCKDFIPIQRKNEWITTKGSEYTKLHAFFNCQALKLTANRGSVENTPAGVLQDIEKVVTNLYRELTEADDWLQLDYLEEEADGYNTVEKERKNYKRRIENANRANIAKYKDFVLVEPKRESGVQSLVVQMTTLEPALFPFLIVDYDTHEGIDMLVKASDDLPIRSSKLYYVEFKHFLSTSFNHSFDNLHSIICWDTKLKHGEEVTDIRGSKMQLVISPRERNSDYTRYLLDAQKSVRKIEVYVLKDYLREKLNLEFRPRTAIDVH